MSTKIDISIIIPTYNDEKGIQNTLDSILSQNFDLNKVEILAIDNNSKDKTAQIIKSYKAVKYLLENKQQSSYAARNKGIHNAKGEILAFIDSECIATQNWLKEGVKQFKNKEVSAVAGGIEFTFQNSNPNIYEYIDSIKKLDQQNYTKIGFAATANVFFKKSLFDKYGLFDQKLKSGGDYEFGTRITNAGEKLIYEKKAMVYHPARNNIKALIKKTIRVAEGQKELSKQNKLNHGKIKIKNLLPTINITKNLYYKKFSLFQKIHLIFTINITKYTNIIHRLK